jgi:hypothetical protein
MKLPKENKSFVRQKPVNICLHMLVYMSLVYSVIQILAFLTFHIFSFTQIALSLLKICLYITVVNRGVWFYYSKE